jgi:hypothetical protein
MNSHTAHRSRPLVVSRRVLSSLKSVRPTIVNLFGRTATPRSCKCRRLLVTCMQRTYHGNLRPPRGGSRLTRETRAFFRIMRKTKPGPTERFHWQQWPRHSDGRILTPAEAKLRAPLTTNRACFQYLLRRVPRRSHCAASTHAIQCTVE